jgi:DnaK suppressor protein
VDSGDDVRRRLEAMRRDLLARHAAERHAARTSAEDPPPLDSGDQSSREELVSYLDALTDRDFHRIRAIEAALARVDDGTYGRCQVCGAAIEAGRLATTPETDLCAAHARMRDGGVQRSRL